MTDTENASNKIFDFNFCFLQVSQHLSNHPSIENVFNSLKFQWTTIQWHPSGGQWARWTLKDLSSQIPSITLSIHRIIRCLMNRKNEQKDEIVWLKACIPFPYIEKRKRKNQGTKSKALGKNTWRQTRSIQYTWASFWSWIVNTSLVWLHLSCISCK